MDIVEIARLVQFLRSYEAVYALSLESGNWDELSGSAWWVNRNKGPWLPLEFIPAIADETVPIEARDLVPRLKAIFLDEGVPEYWVWVAEVESAWDPQAQSRHGAVGLFQLMPNTARRFGLRTGKRDDRYLPDKCARAAAQYLKSLYDQFGCWSLALAAYNAGEGRVARVMRRHRAKSFDEIARHLPLETRTFVPRVLATVALREDPARGLSDW